MNEDLVELTARITSAYVRNNAVPAEGVADVIKTIHNALRHADAPQEQQTESASPAVPIRSSVKPGYIVCLECGRKAKTLKRHLSVEHGLTPEAYREKWRLPTTYPIVAPDYAATRSSLAKQFGLGRRAQRTPEPLEAPPSREPAKKSRNNRGPVRREAEREQLPAPANKRPSKNARA